MNETTLGVPIPILAITRRIMKPKTRAIDKFEAGPAKAMRNSPVLLFFKLYGLYGTGFAQPKVKPAKYVISGTTIVPIGSMCFNGFRVRRPCRRAVGSPRRLAMRPWDTSWMITENIRITIERIVSM